MLRRSGSTLVAVAVVLTAACTDAPTATRDLTSIYATTLARGGGPTPPSAELVALGKALYFDANLSRNRNQSCATCHQPSEGFAAPLTGTVTRGSVVQGSIAGAFGDRKPPTAAYATITPLFSGGNTPTGGVFWDGRATGHVLGNPAADQAMGPFLNPREQALPDPACVLWSVRHASYVAQFTSVWGVALETMDFPADAEVRCSVGIELGMESTTVTAQYHNVALSIAQYESALNTWSSRADIGTLSAAEARGKKLFSSKGKCHTCHTAKGSNAPFTDFAFHNLGLPKNPENPVYNYSSALNDRGLAGFTGNATDEGRFRTPTARNTGLGTNRTFMHNGVLTTLEQVVDFYNTRDVLPACTAAQSAAMPMLRYGSTAFGGIACWPTSETPRNIDSQNMGNLGLTAQEARDIAAFLRALSDDPARLP
jgi:cytochrome c peroxidase